MNATQLMLAKALLMPVLKKLKSDFLRWLIQQDFYRRFTLHVIPFIRFSTYYTSMRGWKFHRGYEKLEPGDIILTVDKKKFSTVVIGGEFSHAGLCVSKDKTIECVEMTHKHFTKSCFVDMCFEADRVVILRCKDFDSEYIQKMIEKAMTFQDQKYDTGFSMNNDFLYCSELIYESDFERRLDVDLEDLAGIGNQYISPTGLYMAGNVDVIWDSDKEELK